ncbi:MAG TPA: YicC/YloC family endoribonuclease, partial [Verrucomicrobiae bacterium]|nr:YicC/YloC family endoribonuclease [Verrucomicrobiae bacterium]
LATCALALGAGGTLEEATVLANHAAGVVVGKLGTATLGADDLRAAIAANRGGRPRRGGGRARERSSRPTGSGGIGAAQRAERASSGRAPGGVKTRVRSMTGYGAGRADAPTARVTVELRSVNQRFLDVKIVAPREYAAWEREVRDRVRAVAQRGRVEVTIARAALAARRRYTVAVRAELARAYVTAARQLGRRLGLAGDVALVDVLRLPDVFEVSEQPPELRGELPALRRALAGALRAFERERRREGAHLRRDMLARAASLRRTTAAIRRRLPRALAVLRSQVEERLVRLVGGAELDRGRVAQEVAVLADRSDVTEELVRLEAHLGALATTLRDRGPVGKRIEFLLQEIQREFNTTGAKAGDREIADRVLGAKAEVEKLREQVQNVE